MQIGDVVYRNHNGTRFFLNNDYSLLENIMIKIPFIDIYFKRYPIKIINIEENDKGNIRNIDITVEATPPIKCVTIQVYIKLDENK